MLRALEDGVVEKMKGEINVPSMSPYIIIQYSLKIGERPKHRDEDQICVEETHVFEYNIYKSVYKYGLSFWVYCYLFTLFIFF
jgi:hypothetical protein